MRENVAVDIRSAFVPSFNITNYIKAAAVSGFGPMQKLYLLKERPATVVPGLGSLL